MPQNTYQPKLPASIHIISTIFSLFVILFRLIYWLFIGIKWLFAPLMLVLNIFLIIPYGKFFVKLPLALETDSIDENILPNCIWWHFKEVSLELARDGFEVGSYIEIKNIAPDMNTFFMSMVNHETQQGAGIIVTVPKKVKLDGTDLPIPSVHGVEFTTYCGAQNSGDQTIVDFTNLPTPDPFPYLKNRQRLFVYDLSARGLYRLFDQFEKTMDCELPVSTVSQLSEKPETIIKSEYLMLVSHALKQNFIKKASDDYAMTWKGATTNGLRTVWPTSSWYKYKDLKKLNAVLEQSGMEVQEYEPEQNPSHRLLEPLFPLDHALIHSKFLLDEYLDTPKKLVSINILNPEAQYPSFNFRFQSVERFPERKAANYGLSEVSIDNSDLQYHINMDDMGLVSTEGFDVDDDREDDIDLKPLEEVLSTYIGYKKVLEVVYQHNDYSQGVEIVDMYLAINEGQPLWVVYLDTDDADDNANQGLPVEITIHAETGKVVE